MAKILIRYGLNRQNPDKRRRSIEHSYGSLEIEGDWSSDETHREIRAKIRESNPGWSISGYCDNSPLTH